MINISTYELQDMNCVILVTAFMMIIRKSTVDIAHLAYNGSGSRIRIILQNPQRPPDLTGFKEEAHTPHPGMNK
jgi:hypothetical protein